MSKELDLSVLPTHLKLQLLSMMNNDKKQASRPAVTKKHAPTKFLLHEKDEDFVDLVVKEIRQNGYFVCDNFVSSNHTTAFDNVNHDSASLIKDAFAEICSMHNDGSLKRAGMGKGVTKLLQEEKRGDLHCWLKAQEDEDYEEADDRPKTPPNLRNILQRISKIRLALNKFVKIHRDADMFYRKYGTNLSHDSIQVAVYPGNGTRYVKHADASPLQSGDRRLTALLYFNDMTKLQGGQLRLYPNERTIASPSIYSNQTPIIEDVEPIWDRLIIFPSECYHEVLPSFSTRYALTLWMYGPDDVHTHILKSLEIREGEIFVSICAYRDSETQYTIKSLFEKAKYPERLWLGICWQYDLNNEEEKKSLFQGYDYARDLSKFANRIIEIHMDHEAAKGPAFARHLINKYLLPLSRSDFYLQIDSHMRFEANWDDDLIQMLQQTEQYASSKKCILTTYPVGYKLPDSVPPSPQLTHICAKPSFIVDSDDGINYEMIRLCGKVLLSKGVQDVIPALFWSANFSFSRSSLGKILYCDPMEYIFFGEEIVMLRAIFDAGYRLFTPNKVICYHLWSRDHRPTFWENYCTDENISQEEDRVKTVTTSIQIGEEYLVRDNAKEMSRKRAEQRQKIMRDLGMFSDDANNEHLRAFQDHCGIDFASRKVSVKAQFGGIEETELLV